MRQGFIKNVLLSLQRFRLISIGVGSLLLLCGTMAFGHGGLGWTLDFELPTQDVMKMHDYMEDQKNLKSLEKVLKDQKEGRKSHPRDVERADKAFKKKFSSMRVLKASMNPDNEDQLLQRWRRGEATEEDMLKVNAYFFSIDQLDLMPYFYNKYPDYYLEMMDDFYHSPRKGS